MWGIFIVKLYHSDKGMLAVWLQVIFWTNAGCFSLGLLETIVSEILVEIQTSLKKRDFKLHLRNRGRFISTAIYQWHAFMEQYVIDSFLT